MALRVKAEEVPVKKVVLSAEQGQGSMVMRQAYGNESSLMVATRPPGYHTKPHMHVSEQINHVMAGEIWFFVEDQGYLCQKGDFHRIPANKVHWAWNRSAADAVVVESHSPPLVGGEIIKSAAALFDEGETPNLRGAGENQFVAYDQEAVERKVFSGEGRNVNNRR
jgi:quercetin dioxygenase-like cupin family protein